MEFGVDYYPEQWEEKDFEEDFQNIRNLGAETVRMAEFAWALLEPELNTFDFSFFDKMLELAGKYSLRVILGTPTATPPPYLVSLFPEIRSKTETGHFRGVGIRRQASLNSRVYLERVSRIVEEMGRHFGGHPGLIGWQIDNEIGHEGTDLDYSDNALFGFQNWLEKKYESVQNLNKILGSVFWGQKFSKFSDIPLPNRTASTGFHPSLIQDFYRFSSETVEKFVNLQADILRKYSNKLVITTNLYPTPFGTILDMEKIFTNLDTVSFDNYPVWGCEYKPRNFSIVSSHLQFIRGLKQKNFSIMEQISGMQGHTVMGYLPPPGQLNAWIVQAVLNGAERIFFFRYRTARFGQEQLCYGIFDHDKKINSRFLEIQSSIHFVKEELKDYNTSKDQQDICVVHSIENNRNFKHQPLCEGLTKKVNNFLDTGYDDEFFNFTAPFFEIGLRPEILPESTVLLEKYRIVVLPLYSMVDERFFENLNLYVEGGGVLILGYRAGFKDKNGWAFSDCIPGPFKNLAGIEVRKFECHPTNKKIRVDFGDNKLNARYYTEILEPIDAEIVGVYRDKKKFYHDKPVITKKRFGKGSVYYIGASFTKKSMKKIYKSILSDCKVKYETLPKNIELVDTFLSGKNVKIMINHSPREVEYGRFIFRPFEIKIL